MRKTHIVTGRGGPAMREKLKERAFAIVSITTSRATFECAYLLRNDEDRWVRIGYCIDGRRSRWETAKVRRQDIREMAYLSPQGRLQLKEAA